MQGFVLEPGSGSSDESIGQAVPTAYVLRPPNMDSADPVPTYSLLVFTEELLEFFQAMNSGDVEARERLRERFRDRIPGKPERFAVILRVSGDDLDSYIQALVAAVSAPKFRGASEEDLKLQAFAHLRMKVLPKIATSRKPRAYLRAAIRNFYRDVASSNQELVSLEDASERTSLAFGIEPGPGTVRRTKH
jgi:hypothetical protein